MKKSILSLIFILSFFFSSINIHGDFSQKYQKLQNNVDTVLMILQKMPEAIKSYDEERLFLEEEYITVSGNRPLIQLNNKSEIPLIELVQDSSGAYLLYPIQAIEKLFKHVCNKCGHEWAGGVLPFNALNVEARI